MSVKVKGVVARAKGEPVTWRRSSSRSRARARRWCRSRRAGCATPTCTTARAASTTTSRSCSATRPPAWSRRSARRHRRRARATSSSSTGARCAGSAAPAGAGGRWYCFATHNATQKMTLEDGTVLSPALGIGAFAEKTLVAAGQCTKVDPAAPPEVAGLLGCGVMAGLGAAINTGEVGRGDTVAVIGCGGVGDAAIAGARLAGARTIIAVDIDDRKLEWAKEFGATAHRELARRRPGRGDPGVDRRATAPTSCIEAVGSPRRYEQAFYARDLAGTVVQVGVPDAGDAPRPADDRLLRPRRRAQAALVRRLPAEPRLPDADRPVPAGAARSTGSSARRSRSTTSRRRSPACSGARCFARSSWWAR